MLFNLSSHSTFVTAPHRTHTCTAGSSATHRRDPPKLVGTHFVHKHYTSIPYIYIYIYLRCTNGCQFVFASCAGNSFCAERHRAAAATRKLNLSTIQRFSSDICMYKQNICDLTFYQANFFQTEKRKSEDA